MPLRIFPVAGGAIFTNDWAEPGSVSRTHLGNDLFANEGVPLLAVDDGEVRFGTDPLGGNVANLRANDGTRYYYAHLSGFEGSNRIVRAGEVIGYLGKTGNAASTRPHTHFEVHPAFGGTSPGAAVNPFPLLTNAPRLPIPSQSSGGGTNRLAAALAAASAALITWWGIKNWPSGKRKT